MNNFKDFDYCPDNTSHVFINEDIWHEDKQLWEFRQRCLKCDEKINIGSSDGKCWKSKDKKHNFIEGVFVNSMVIAEGKHCVNCGCASGKIIE